MRACGRVTLHWSPTCACAAPTPSTCRTSAFPRGCASPAISTRRCAVRRSSSRPYPRTARATSCDCAVPRIGAGAILVSATKGLERDTLFRASRDRASRSWGSGAGRRCCPVRASPPKWRASCRRRCPSRRLTPRSSTRCRWSSAGRYFRLYGTSDVVGVEIGGALKNVIAIAAGRGRGPRARAQRAGRPDHPRPGRDRPGWPVRRAASARRCQA